MTMEMIGCCIGDCCIYCWRNCIFLTCWDCEIVVACCWRLWIHEFKGNIALLLLNENWSWATEPSFLTLVDCSGRLYHDDVLDIDSDKLGLMIGLGTSLHPKGGDKLLGGLFCGSLHIGNSWMAGDIEKALTDKERDFTIWDLGLGCWSIVGHANYWHGQLRHWVCPLLVMTRNGWNNLFDLRKTWLCFNQQCHWCGSTTWVASSKNNLCWQVTGSFCL